MPLKFDPSSDPYSWKIFRRTVADTIDPDPLLVDFQNDQRMPGSDNGGTGVVHFKFTTATSVTFQPYFYNSRFDIWMPSNTTYTKTPADPTEKFDTWGSPFAIAIIAIVGGGSVDCAFAHAARNIGGN